MKRLAFQILPQLFIASTAIGEESRQLDAHEHGVGALNIAVEGGQISMEFHAPGADIVGFEHHAESDADRAAIASAIALLEQPLTLFTLPEAAACAVTEASAGLAGEGHEKHGDHDEHDHDKGHDDHAKEEEDDHDDHDHDKDHDDHAEHKDHDDHMDAEGHTEFHAEYMLSCAQPAAIDQINFAYFTQFENAQQLEIQLISANGAQAFEVARDAPMLDVKGLFSQ